MRNKLHAKTCINPTSGTTRGYKWDVKNCINPTQTHSPLQREWEWGAGGQEKRHRIAMYAKTTILSGEGGKIVFEIRIFSRARTRGACVESEFKRSIPAGLGRPYRPTNTPARAKNSHTNYQQSGLNDFIQGRFTVKGAV